MNESLQMAIQLFRSGETKTGRHMLVEFLKREPDNENAWLFMAEVVQDIDRQIECLERVLSINPQNTYALETLTDLRSRVEEENSIQLGSARIDQTSFHTHQTQGAHRINGKPFPQQPHDWPPPPPSALGIHFASNAKEADNTDRVGSKQSPSQPPLYSVWSHPNGGHTRLIVLGKDALMTAKPPKKVLPYLCSTVLSGRIPVSADFPEKVIMFGSIRQISYSKRGRCISIKHEKNGEIKKDILDFASQYDRSSLLKILRERTGGTERSYVYRSNRFKALLVPFTVIILVILSTLLFYSIGWQSPLSAEASALEETTLKLNQIPWLLEWVGFTAVLSLTGLALGSALLWAFGCIFYPPEQTIITPPSQKLDPSSIGT